VGIIAALFMTGFGRLFGPRKGALAALLGIAAYTLLAGAGPPVVRAAIMGGLALFARQVGRRQDGLNSLAFTAALMAACDPQLPWHAGFQLSFAATLGLVLYAEPLTQAFQRLVAKRGARIASRLSPVAIQRISRLVGEYFLFTLAAQVMTLPVTLYHFGQASLSALLANPLVLPAPCRRRLSAFHLIL
jgi:competence protein ComEC